MATTDIDSGKHGITPAKLTWREDEAGNLVPVSQRFDDVYYSLADGLAESRYVFLQHNHLPERFAQLWHTQSPDTFTIAELGFGTGLNLLATWQLWQTFASANSSSATPRLHVISFEKHPLTRSDLQRSLAPWAKADATLAPLVTCLLERYPVLVAGCHRLVLSDTVTLDLWLGDANDTLAKLAGQHQINVWFLDGFAPSQNASMWADAIFEQMARLSAPNATAATFSCAGMVKRGLQNAGFTIHKVKGFGRKREMLTALFDSLSNNTSDATFDGTSDDNVYLPSNATSNTASPRLQNVAVIGAGVAGLMTAWALACRGINVTLLDKDEPLAGASGNPRAVLAPKMTPIAHVDEHLHSLGYLYACRFYRVLNKQLTPSAPPIFEQTGVLDLLTNANIDVAQIGEYPDEMATTVPLKQAKELLGMVGMVGMDEPDRQQDPKHGLTHDSAHNLAHDANDDHDASHSLGHNLYLPQGGLVNPQALAQQVLSHPNVCYRQGAVTHIQSPNTSSSHSYQPHQPCQSHQPQLDNITIIGKHHTQGQRANDFEHKTQAVVICTADASHQLDGRIFDFRKIRGQLSWWQVSAEHAKHLPRLPVKYGGYCAPYLAQSSASNPSPTHDTLFLFGASFVRNDTACDIRASEHQSNLEKLITALPELKKGVATVKMKEDLQHPKTWHARVGIRAQTPDYHPVVGQIDDAGNIWTMSGMGSKGFAFAPLCSEVLADLMLGDTPPVSQQMLNRLSPYRKALQRKLNQNE